MAATILNENLPGWRNDYHNWQCLVFFAIICGRQGIKLGWRNRLAPDAVKLWDLFSEQNPSRSIATEVQELKWTKPQMLFFKLNVDGALAYGGGSAVGGVIRDVEGYFMAAWSKPVAGISDVDTMEALAVKECLQLAYDFGFYNLCMEGDAQNVLRALATKQMVASAIGVIFHDIQELTSFMRNIHLQWVSKLTNGVAHRLIQYGKSISNEFVWLEDSSIFLFGEIYNSLDKVYTYYFILFLKKILSS